MENILPLEECSIQQIYIDSQETIIYKIPIYQRNYAWEDDEITALIKDVYDSLHKNPSAPYYIGTLVTYKRGDNEYEVIDGQQRLTTIYLILKALGKPIKNKLTYSARKISADTIQHLPDFGDEYDRGIWNGFAAVKKAIQTIVGEKEKDVFTDYFLEKVHIIHYKVPKDVDLNHYFEVMNSRGEQLEKHEIVKSLLSWYLKDKKDLATFCYVWEACSDMNVYIQQTFEEPVIFGNKLENFEIDGFEDIPQHEASDDKPTILSLIGKKIENVDIDNDTIQNDKFQPIIDFPNFLLIVLKLTLFHDYEGVEPENIILDDKDLLSEFQKVLQDIEDKEEFAEIFIFNLLEARYFLDNYVVHHVLSQKECAGDNPWQLQYFCKQNKYQRYTLNLFGDSDMHKELVQLLSMFEVSFTPKQRKNYLFYCLAFLFDNDDDDYLDFVRALADKYFYDVYLNKSSLNERNQPLPNAFDNVILRDDTINVEVKNSVKDYVALFESIYQYGRSDIPLFVFNYTDYKIWKKYVNDLKGTKATKDSLKRKNFFADLGCDDFGLDTFTYFYFSRTRKSLEHYYPQAKAVRDDEARKNSLTVSQINCFGNFAMIGAEANSSGSDWDPKTKLDHYLDKKSNPISVSSLKFRIMMQRCKDNDYNLALKRPQSMAWNFDDIQDHQKRMLNILFDSTK